MIIIRNFILFLALTVIINVAHAADDISETKGPLISADQGQIAPDIWAGVTQAEAYALISAMPSRFSSSIYFEIARRFLLSDAPALKATPEANDKKKDKNKKQDDEKETQAPQPVKTDILLVRMDKLLEMGALRDAQNLYDTVVTQTPENFELFYRNVQMLMLHGQLSAACLDLQAAKKQHASNPKWKDLNNFCRIQFAGAAERSKLLSETKFETMPKLGTFLRGQGFEKLSKLSTDDLAYAVALGVVNPSSIAQWAPKAASLHPLLLSVLIEMDTPDVVPEKTCLAIEATRRGLLSTRDLITIYEKPHYDAALLLDYVGVQPSPSDIHPCMIPTVLYQRVASNIKLPTRDRAIREALDVMKNLPDAALWPLAVYFRDFDVKTAVNKPYLWRVSRIVAYEKGELPESWAVGWGKQGGIGVSPFWPIQGILKPDGNATANFETWKAQWPSEVKRIKSHDPVVPLLLEGVMYENGSKSLENPKKNLSDYENIISLTFSRSYAIPSYGLTQRLADVIDKDQTGLSVALLLIGFGAIPPDQVIPNQMALVINGMNKAGLAQYARRFALEVLQ
jgi:hypothetical protein